MAAVAPIEVEEFSALRATVRQLATVRAVVTALAGVGWAAVVTAIMLVVPASLLLTVPLVVLLASFEVNVGIVRTVDALGAYLRVRFEERRGAVGWETASAVPAMDLLSFWTFVVLVAANYLCVVIAVGEATDPSSRVRDDTLDLGLVTMFHGLVILRFVFARRALLARREAELSRLRRLWPVPSGGQGDDARPSSDEL